MATAFRASTEVSHLAVAFFDRFVAVRRFSSQTEDRVYHLTLACMHLAITFADTPEALVSTPVAVFAGFGAHPGLESAVLLWSHCSDRSDVDS